MAFNKPISPEVFTPFYLQQVVLPQWYRVLYSLVAGLGQYSDAETPVGLVNGINVNYTITNIPNPAKSLMLFIWMPGFGGVLQLQGTDYTIAGNAITFAVAPAAGGTLVAYYRY